jgi:PilZ domain
MPKIRGMTRTLAPLPGWPITVIRMVRSAGVQHSGLVTTALARVLVVTAEGVDTWRANDKAVLAAGEHGQRLVTLGEVASIKANRAVLLAPADWRCLDLRTSERHEIRLTVAILFAGKRETVSGQTIDISRGGLAVETGGSIEAGDVEVLMRWNGFESHLPCSIVEVRDDGARHILHMRFRDLSGHQTAFVRSVVSEIEEREFHDDLPS